MRRRSSQSIVANPVLVGAVTTLVVIVAVFLAYNANNGLPFVPTKQLKVNVSNGSNLVKGNDVREGGFRIGVLEGIKPVLLPNGVTAAQLTLKLDKVNGDIPKDSRIKIRPRSALGLKYIELYRGQSKSAFADGATMAMHKGDVPEQFDDVYRTFDEKTRIASQKNLEGFGDALAGRGMDLNVTIRNLPNLFRHLVPVAQNLTDKRTGLPGFFKGLNRAASTVAPIAKLNAKTFTQLADTFGAFAKDTRALQATISKSPSTMDVVTTSLRVQRPFLRDTTAFSADLSAAASEFRRALPTIDSALERGSQVLPRTNDMNRRLGDTLAAARDLARAPGTNLAIRALNGTFSTLNPQLRFYGPYVTVCNNWNYFWTYLSEHLSEEDQNGFAQRALLNSSGQQDNSVGTQGAVDFTQGKNYNPLSAPRGSVEKLHGQPYGAAIDNRGNADCEKGQRGYPEGNLSPFVPKSVKIVTNPHTPGNQGTTYSGRSRVPAGETFTREPQTGPQLDPRVRP
ncbi:MAG: MlaD family protein [Solirubrobacteraceae bacterium]